MSEMAKYQGREEAKRKTKYYDRIEHRVGEESSIRKGVGYQAVAHGLVMI